MIRICGNQLKIDGTKYEVKNELVTLLTYVYRKNKQILGNYAANGYLMELMFKVINNKDEIDVENLSENQGFME